MESAGDCDSLGELETLTEGTLETDTLGDSDCRTDEIWTGDSDSLGELLRTLTGESDPDALGLLRDSATFATAEDSKEAGLADSAVDSDSLKSANFTCCSLADL